MHENAALDVVQPYRVVSSISSPLQGAALLPWSPAHANKKSQELWDRSCFPPCSDLHGHGCAFQWKGMEILPISLLFHF